jgi:two-component system, chemotaxis family, CheB/CheR fusion protein
MSTTQTPNAQPPLQEDGARDGAGLMGQTSTLHHTSLPSHIVGIGASAGGLEALMALFDRMPPHTDLAFVVVQHLSPDFKSLLDELLAQHTQMAIHWAADQMLIEANTLYLIPPLTVPALSQGRFRLCEPTPATRRTRLPIDTFLGSLAEDVGHKAIAIVLSGIGRDGALGIRAVKQRGGMVLVQAPDSAAFDGMPRHAVAMGMADVVAPPDEMARALVRYVAHPPVPPLTSACPPGSIGVSRFFREPDAFAELEHKVIPKLVQQAKSTGKIRVWVSACATGEEAYTIAMLIREQCDQLATLPEIKIFATDVEPEALEAANIGLYPQRIAADVSPPRLQRFFVRCRTGYQVKRELRELLIVAPHNLLQDPPLAQMDLIVCRHFLSNLEPHLHPQVLTPLLFALRPQGYLFLGPSDALGKLEDACLTLHPQWKLFQKNRDLQVLPPMAQPPRTPMVDTIMERLHERLVALYSPPTLVVNEQQEVVHMSGDVSPYLRAGSGRSTLNVLQLLIDDLARPVQTLLKRIVTDQDEVVLPHIAVRAGDENQYITLRGHWMPAIGKTPNLTLLCFDTAASDTPPSTLADLRSSHAALQGRHEEILASHAELQRSYDMLQAANEVLYTVNVEYRNKIAELTRCNASGELSQD